jgi:hypothetical protein
MEYPLRDADVARLNNTFTYHAPKDNQQQRYGQIAERG